MNERDETYADKMLSGMLSDLTSGLSFDEALADNGAIQKALRLAVAEFLSRDLSSIKTTELPKHIQALVKAQDENTRMLQFLDGRADSRPEASWGASLRGLTDEQLRVVMGWVEENARTHDTP